MYRLAATAPEIKMNLLQVTQFILNQLTHLFQHMNKTTWQLSAKISCQLAINQCGSVDYHGKDSQLLWMKKLFSPFSIDI